MLAAERNLQPLPSHVVYAHDLVGLHHAYRAALLAVVIEDLEIMHIKQAF
jgi:hypothetical protein